MVLHPMATAELCVELEALAFRLELDQADPGAGETDDSGLIRAAILRLQHLETYSKMEAM